MRGPRRRSIVVVLCAFALALGGCVERTLLIRSEPTGATVVVNGRAAGIAPVALPFKTYGAFEVTAGLDGHQRLRRKHIPLDFIAENVWPFMVRDEHNVTLKMKPVLPADDEGIGRREEELRKRLEKGRAGE